MILIKSAAALRGGAGAEDANEEMCPEWGGKPSAHVVWLSCCGLSRHLSAPFFYGHRPRLADYRSALLSVESKFVCCAWWSEFGWGPSPKANPWNHHRFTSHQHVEREEPRQPCVLPAQSADVIPWFTFGLNKKGPLFSDGVWLICEKA